jgi:hypothetical protein
MNNSLKHTDPIHTLTRQEIIDRFTHTIRGLGSPGRTPQEIRQTEAHGKPMHFESYPISLQDFTAILSYLDQEWHHHWLPARELPEYVRQDKRALMDMEIFPAPRILGPNQGEQDQLISWDVAEQDTDDPDLMGCIVTRQLSSGETFVEFWLGGFPDLDTFDDMRCDIEEEMACRLLAGLDALHLPTSDERATTSEEIPQQSPDDKTPPATHPGTLQNVTVEQAKRLVSDRNTMLQYMPRSRGYDPSTAKAIVSAIPTAWENNIAGQWGPACIAEACGFSITSVAVGHYLKAFIERGIRTIEGIEIPHRSRKKHSK